MKRNVFQGENEIRSWCGVMLTDRRVVQVASASGKTETTSLLVSEVEWTSLASEHHPALLVLAFLGVIIGVPAIVGGEDVYGGMSLLFAVVGVIAYVLTRKTHVVIGAGAAKITITIEGKNHAPALEFLDAVEVAALVARSGGSTAARRAA